MLIKVIYQSKTGNTEKVAVSIATATGIRSESIGSAKKMENVDLLFIGAGIIGGKVDASMLSFIAGLDSTKVKNAAIFGTYGWQKKGLEVMKELLKAQGINVLDEAFGCKGKFWAIFNSKHPDDKDLSNAVTFANRAIKQVKNA